LSFQGDAAACALGDMPSGFSLKLMQIGLSAVGATNGALPDVTSASALRFSPASATAMRF
jgi:hypothetical protein